MNIGGWAVWLNKDDRHVIPEGEDHLLGLDCRCCPRQDDEDPGVIIHNSFDGREHYERGGRKMS